MPVSVNRESGSIVPLEGETFSTYVEDVLVTYKGRWKENEETKLPTTMTTDVAKRTLKSHQFIYRQRSLEKVNLIPQPVLRADGRLEMLKE